MNSLAELNRRREAEIVELRDRLTRKWDGVPAVKLSDYPLSKLREQIAEALKGASGREGLRPQLDFVDRGRFGADLAVTIPQLLKEGGAKAYIQNHVPWIKTALASEALAAAVEHVDQKGMYLNVRLRNAYLMQTLDSVLAMASDFGRSDAEVPRRFVIDYSSPNVAKQLHAGHIRATMIGHVLGNLHEAAGARVFRVNHINDLGGFGFTLEGYRRWQDRFPAGLTPNQKLLQLYALRRALERAVEKAGPLEGLDPEDLKLIRTYLPQVTTIDDLRREFTGYSAAADRAFERLEAGEASEVELWKQMVDWSMADFQSFYDALDIHIDFVIGESFYVEAGNRLVDEALATGTAVLFTEELAQQARQDADARLAREELTPAAHAALVEQIGKDVGAVVIPLGQDERLVVRRSDGRSIYATRDLGALAVRRRLFHPTDITYVVGQEQRLHFEQVFKAAKVLRIFGDEDVQLKHIYFGFYVDPRTKKKLSSRQGASNVNHLLESSIEHFAAKYQGNPAWSKEVVDSIARQLAVGSLIFNDLKKDMKTSVDIPVDSFDEIITAYEQSGGAYVVYSACRARSILRKFGGEVLPSQRVGEFDLNEMEVKLTLQIQQTPEKIADAADRNDPSILLRHLLDMAATYNTYYTQSQVLTEGGTNMPRLLITESVRQTLENALRVVHVEAPERI